MIVIFAVIINWVLFV